MFIVQISLPIVTFLSLISRNLSLMQITKEVNPHPHIAPCVNIWSVTFLFLFFVLCHLLNVGTCVCHIAQEGQVEWTTISIGDGRKNSICPHISSVLFRNVTCYTNSIISRIHVNTTKLYNIRCILVATSVILHNLECSSERRSHVSAKTLMFLFLFFPSTSLALFQLATSFVLTELPPPEASHKEYGTHINSVEVYWER